MHSPLWRSRAVQLAFGHDLSDRWQAVADQSGKVVNRAGKRFEAPQQASTRLRADCWCL